MNITVFGASGVGGHVIALAAQRGHHARAVYWAAPGTPPPGQSMVLIVPGIFDPAFAAEAIRGASRRTKRSRLSPALQRTSSRSPLVNTGKEIR